MASDEIDIGLPVREGQHFALRPASLSVLGHDAAHLDRRVIMLWNECPYPSGPHGDGPFVDGEQGSCVRQAPEVGPAPGE